jgi:hypothetical protein
MEIIFLSWRVQILCSCWITDFSELHQELKKTDQGHLAGFEISKNMFQRNNYPLKSQEHNALHMIKSTIANLASLEKLSEKKEKKIIKRL